MQIDKLSKLRHHYYLSRTGALGYVETILEPGERVTHRAHLHWIIFWRAVVLMLIGGLMCFTADSNGVAIIGFILVLLGALSLLRAAIARWTTEIAVTNRRVILRHGLIRRDTIEINMPQVESVYGTVLVRGTGGGLNPLAYVSAPLPLRRAVQLSGQTSVSPA